MSGVPRYTEDRGSVPAGRAVRRYGFSGAGHITGGRGPEPNREEDSDETIERVGEQEGDRRRAAPNRVDGSRMDRQAVEGGRDDERGRLHQPKRVAHGERPGPPWRSFVRTEIRMEFGR